MRQHCNRGTTSQPSSRFANAKAVTTSGAIEKIFFGAFIETLQSLRTTVFWESWIWHRSTVDKTELMNTISRGMGVHLWGDPIGGDDEMVLEGRFFHIGCVPVGARRLREKPCEIEKASSWKRGISGRS